MTEKRSLRDQMPSVTAFVDDLREAFGRDQIDAVIRSGMRGNPVFHATENGHEIGTPLPEADGVKLSETVVGRIFPEKKGRGR